MRKYLVGVTFCLSLLLLFVFAQRLVGQEVHTVDFLIPTGVTIVGPDPGSSEPGDVVLYTGRPSTRIQIDSSAGCFPPVTGVRYAVQNVVIVGPRTGRPARPTEVITWRVGTVDGAVEAPEMAAGTRLSSMQFISDQGMINGIAYTCYRAGVVD